MNFDLSVSWTRTHTITNPEIKKKKKENKKNKKQNPKTFWTNFKSSARVSPSFITALLSLISKRNHG